MNRHQRRALDALRFDWAYTPEDVWRTSSYHIDGLHDEVLHGVADGMRDARDSDAASPVGVAILGQHGTGKTHLLCVVREQVQSGGGYFFLVDLLDAGAFWQRLAHAIIDGLLRETDRHERQLLAFLRRLCRQAGIPNDVQAAVTGERPLSRGDLTSFVVALRRLDRRIGLECQDTARALVLLSSDDYEVQDIGHQYLQSAEEANPGERLSWGLRRHAPPPDLVVKNISRLLALTGPSVIAIDQIDPLVAVATKLPLETGLTVEDGRDAVLLDQLAAGLMSLRDVSRRTLSVVACLPESWLLIKDRTVNTVRDRFRETLQLHRIPTVEIGRAIIERRFGARFQSVEFDPPYPTWPVLASAFDDAPDFTPRALLQRVGAHVQSCLRTGEVRELARLTDVEPIPAQPPGVANGDDLAALDARFQELRAGADLAAALDPRREDEAMPALLAAALTAWIAERGDDQGAFALDPPPSRKPALHARLRRSLDETTEDERHWAFRAIASDNARAAQARIRNACTMAALRQGAARGLYLLRNTPWPAGPVTRQVVTELTDAGGVVLPVTDDDLRTFSALRRLLDDRDSNLQPWLAARLPASGTGLLRAALAAENANRASERAEPHRRPAVGRARVGARPAASGHPPDGREPAVTLGVTVEDQRPVRATLESLRKHVAIFAGSGSGKTVLIRRLVEECALHGVSAIVLDPNNDLARLGDPWPEPPAQWGPGDAGTAADYLANTDVVVWTPRREAGRPLSFHPLPDFGSVQDDPDELGAAIDAAVAALAPRARVDGRTSRAAQGKAVLHETLRFFARQGGEDLKSFVDLLADLPAGVSALGRADRIGAELAESLTAAMVIDPLFGGDATPVDPGRLLTPRTGKRARVSVISLVGLPSDEQRQSFVNQLQMALFAWIKRHPAGDRPLGGLFVMDEAQTFAPSGAMTPCTESTLALATQARKYGLGLVFATQAPKGLHNQIPGNAATQLFGFLNSPVQIEAAGEMARAKGSAVLDISRLTTGQFYATGEGLPFRKVQTPLCLSYHPKSPLTNEEVVARARAAAPASATAGVSPGAVPVPAG
ncbi:MAG: DUF87 domain-containing protein [Micromonosporaceae bacterium]|nr:DUF87 domain-containing protein [Micromonosporaceae bacterium]